MSYHDLTSAHRPAADALLQQIADYTLAVDRVTSIAHQTHGAIGFTYEHGLHFATRRLWAWRAEFGSDAYWAGELGRTTLARGAAALWPDLTARAATGAR